MKFKNILQMNNQTNDLHNQKNVIISYGVILGFTLILNFLFYNLFFNSVVSGAIGSIFVVCANIVLLIFLYKETDNLQYGVAFKNGTLVGVISGICFAIFFLIYTNIIDTYYFENIGVNLIQKWRNEDYNSFTIDQMLNTIGIMRKYHIYELSTIILASIKSFALSMIISPFFVKRQNNFTF